MTEGPRREEVDAIPNRRQRIAFRMAFTLRYEELMVDGLEGRDQASGVGALGPDGSCLGSKHKMIPLDLR
jgi:hypothetical protein